jgi:hypothetical protein
VICINKLWVSAGVYRKRQRRQGGWPKNTLDRAPHTFGFVDVGNDAAGAGNDVYRATLVHRQGNIVTGGDWYDFRLPSVVDVIRAWAQFRVLNATAHPVLIHDMRSSIRPKRDGDGVGKCVDVRPIDCRNRAYHIDRGGNGRDKSAAHVGPHGAGENEREGLVHNLRGPARRQVSEIVVREINIFGVHGYRVSSDYAFALIHDEAKIRGWAGEGLG